MNRPSRAEATPATGGFVSRTKKNPTSSPAKRTDAGLPMVSPRGTVPSLPFAGGDR